MMRFWLCIFHSTLPRVQKMNVLRTQWCFQNVRNEDFTRHQAQWNLDAAEWIISERHGKQKSQEVCKWESNQQKEFQKCIDPTKGSSLDADQIAFLQAISFPLNGSGVSGRTDKKRPATKGSTGSTSSKRAQKDSSSSRARAKASSIMSTLVFMREQLERIRTKLPGK